MPKHSFIRVNKLPDVCGRVDYISNQKRQEHLYAVYSTVEPIFWQRLSEQSQLDFRRSNQPDGKCTEARELIIALPAGMQQHDPNLLLKLFVETFQMKYGMQCTAALHHNKSMVNYHIHLIFSDRDMLEKTEVKYASRNMFYNEEGRHVRTKKDILDADGNVRPGCKILPKGEPYEIKWFSGKKDEFKSKQFVQDVKVMYTDMINSLITDEQEKLNVFDPEGPYLATKKIGKNNPMQEEIAADNAARQEWNRLVDQTLIAGATEEDLVSYKQDYVTEPIRQSILLHGQMPGLLAGIIRTAIVHLRTFFRLLMENAAAEYEIDPTQESSTGDMESHVSEKKSPANDKGPRPDSSKKEAEYRRLGPMHQRLYKLTSKIQAIEKKKALLYQILDMTPDNLFHRKERKELQSQIDGLQRQIDKADREMDMVLAEYGYQYVREAEADYKKCCSASYLMV